MKSNPTREALIAPCGMDCRLCRAYVRDKRACPGCRMPDDGFKSHACVTCAIKNCDKFQKQGIRFCFSCDEFPCMTLRHLNERYKKNYGMSPIENLINIESLGIGPFVQLENKRWTCSKCSGMLCVHKAQCPSCGHSWRE